MVEVFTTEQNVWANSPPPRPFPSTLVFICFMQLALTKRRECCFVIVVVVGHACALLVRATLRIICYSLPACAGRRKQVACVYVYMHLIGRIATSVVEAPKTRRKTNEKEIKVLYMQRWCRVALVVFLLLSSGGESRGIWLVDGAFYRVYTCVVSCFLV